MSKCIIKNNDDEQQSTKKRFFFRKRKFIDPACSLVFESGETYEENKRRYHEALHAVFTGKCKNMFEAHKIYG